MALSDFRSKDFLSVLALGLLLRAGFVALFDHHPVSDESDYLLLAGNLVHRGTYEAHGVVIAYRPVGYPAFLSLIISLAGRSIVAIRVVQIALDLSIIVALFSLGKQFERRQGLIAGLLWAVFPPAILYSGLVLSETLSVCLLVWLFVLAMNHARLAHPAIAFLAGSLGGMLALVKPWTLVFLLLLVVLYLGKRVDKKALVLVVGGLLFMIVPWMTRNYLALGTFSLSTNTGAKLFIGNNPESTGSYRDSFPKELLQHAGNQEHFSEEAGKIAVTYILNNPLIFAWNAVRKTAHILRGEGELLVWAFHKDMRDPATSFAEQYRSVPFVAILVVNPAYWILMIIGILGFLRLWPQDFTVLIILFTAALFAVHAVFFGGARFHFPLMPFLSLCAARVLPHVNSHFKAITHRQKIIYALLVPALLGLWTYEFVYVF